MDGGADEVPEEVIQETDTAGFNTETDDEKKDAPQPAEYAYIGREHFTSEAFKIEISNIPKYFGFGECKKLLKNKLKLNPHKIKRVPHLNKVYVTFKNEDEKTKALEKLHMYKYKGSVLAVKSAKPKSDAMALKRPGDGQEEAACESKRSRPDAEHDNLSPSELLMASVNKWHDVPYEEQLARKQSQIKQFLCTLRRRLGKQDLDNEVFVWVMKHKNTSDGMCCPLHPIIPSPVQTKYRNKSEFTIGINTSGLKTVGNRLGKYRDQTCAVEEATPLIILPDKMKEVASKFQEYVRNSDKGPYNPQSYEGHWRQLTVRTSLDGEALGIVITSKKDKDGSDGDETNKEKEDLKQQVESGCLEGVVSTLLYQSTPTHRKSASDITPPELLHGNGYITEKLLGLKFRISAEAFFQCNTLAAEVLYSTIGSMLQNGDLYGDGDKIGSSINETGKQSQEEGPTIPEEPNTDMKSYSAEEARDLIFSGDLSGGYTSSECEEDVDDFESDVSRCSPTIYTEALDRQTECEVEELGGIAHIDVDTSEWKDVEKFDRGPHFHEFTPRMPPGPNNVEHLEGAKPCEFFKLFFSDDLVEEITAETNIYAAQKRSSLDTSPNSRLNRWKETNGDEIYLLIGLLLNMGIVRLPALHMYWTTNSSYNLPFFSRIMSRDRFQLLYHTMLHCCSTDDTNRISGDKIDPIIQKLIKKFQRHYYPYRNVSSDETMIGYKGRVAFRRYMPNKPVKWGMLARTIADAKTGYIFNIKMDYGSGSETSAPPGLAKLSANVFHLMKDYLDCGHHVFVDRLYSSVPLAEALDQRKTSITGTIMANRRGLPDEMKTTKLAKGQKLCLRKGQLLALKWQDEKPISLLSTFCLGHEVVSKQVRGRQEPVDKPACIDLYNTNMGGVDLADQYNAYYDFARKSIKWWKKIFFWLVETSMTNSFIIYKMTRQEGKEVTLLKYRKMVIEGLIETVTAKNRHILGTKSPRTSLSLSPEKRLDGKFHAQDKSGKQRACKACTIKGQNRRGTTYFCATCDDQPHLHPGDCFTRYHTLKDYKKAE